MCARAYERDRVSVCLCVVSVVCGRCSFGMLFLSCVCVSVSGVLFSLCVCDLLIFLPDTL